MSDEYDYSGSLDGSESEYDYGSDDGGDGYSEGEGEDGELDLAVDLENTYYLADGTVQLHDCDGFEETIILRCEIHTHGHSPA